MVKSIKKLMAVILSLTLITGIPMGLAFAETSSNVTLVGLNEVSVNNNTYKYANLRIQILDDSVAVFSNPYDPGYYISSETLLLALASDNGYTLSYVLTTDGEDTEVNHVTGGFIKAVKDGADTLYIPIVNKANQVDNIQLGWSKRGWTEVNTTGASRPSTKDIGGKSEAVNGDDVWSRGVVVSSVSDQPPCRLILEGNKDANNTSNISGWVDNYDTTFTYVFNFFAENVAMPIVYANEVLVRFDSDGCLEYRSGGAGSETTQYVKTDYKITANRWHQLAITFCSGRWRPYIFLDGVNVVGSKSWYDWKVSEVAIGAIKSVVGEVYFNDVRYYEGYYTPENEIITAPAAVSNVKIDTKNKLISYAGIDNLDELKTAIKANCNASAVNVYNAPLSKTYIASESLDNANNVVVLTSPNGLRYDYYTLSNLDISDIVFDVEEGNIKASVAAFDSSLNSPKLYIASYSENELMNVNATDVTLDGEVSDTSIPYNSKFKYKAFLWDATLTPIKVLEY